MSRTVELTRVYHFSAAHQLVNPALSVERQRGALRPVRAPARPQLLSRGHRRRRAGSRPPGLPWTWWRSIVRSDRASARAGRSPSPRGRPGAGGRDHHRRRSGPRVLAHAGRRAAARAAPARGRARDREESVRVPGRGGGLMADDRTLPQLVEQMLKELGEDPHREGLERTRPSGWRRRCATSRPATPRTCTRS